MNNDRLWAEALHLHAEDGTLLASVLRHIRDAIREGGYLSRGRITGGIKEAYRPIGVADDALRTAIDEAIDLLTHTGDIGELPTKAGRGYASTPPRRLIWGGADNVVLGSVSLSSGDAVRRASMEALSAEAIPTPLLVELERPAWRTALVEIGGADDPDGSPVALSAYAQTLASSGTRYSLDEPSALAVLSGSGEFFGSPDGPTGRWMRAENDGFYPAAISSGYTQRRVLLAIDNGTATLWEPPDRDIWHWIVVGFTLAAGQPVWRYDHATEILHFLTPPPRQVERAALLTGEQVRSWSWRIDPQAHAIIAGLLGCPHS